MQWFARFPELFRVVGHPAFSRPVGLWLGGALSYPHLPAVGVGSRVNRPAASGWKLDLNERLAEVQGVVHKKRDGCGIRFLWPGLEVGPFNPSARGEKRSGFCELMGSRNA